MEKAIKIAIKGGYKEDGWKPHWVIGEELSVNIYEALLDPKFWQAIGRAEKWYQFAWEKRQQEMLTHIQNGGTGESFFEELLS